MMSFVKTLQHSLPKPLLFALYGAFGSFAGALLLGELLWAVLVPPPPPPPLPPQPALRIAVSPSLSVNQGNVNQFVVKIARDNFMGDVTITCSGLPRGLSVKDVVIPSDKEEVELEATATKDAEVGPQAVKVIASGKSVTGETPIEVTVVEVPIPPPPQVDIVFVLDVTGSMGFALNGIIQGIGDFARELDSRKLDAQLGLLAFQDTLIGEQSRVLTFEKGSPFTKDYEVFRKELSTVGLGGGGDEPESSLDALVEAARLPFRRDATKVLLLVTDASPHIPDKSVQSLEDCRGVLQKMGISQLHIVVRPEHQKTYARLQEKESGEYFNLAEAAGGGAGFARILPSVSTAIAKITIQSRPPAPTTFATAKAAPPPALPSIKGVQSSREFSQESRWRLLAAIAVWTSIPAIAITVILLAGQQFYLRETGLPLFGVLKGAAIGCAAGLFGGAAGQFLYGLFPPMPLLDAGFRVFGWSLLGACVAFGTSLSIPNLRSDRALLGGALGGAAGALGFLATSLALPSNVAGDVGGRLVGATLIGFFIGLMVAWVESKFRSGWLEIRYGTREVRRVNLGPEPVSLGSDSRRCTIYVPGSADVAFRYRVAQSKVMREAVATGQVDEIRDGDRHTIGNVEVTVRTSANVSTVADAPRTVVPPPPKLLTPATAPSTGGGTAPQNLGPRDSRSPLPPPPMPPRASSKVGDPTHASVVPRPAALISPVKPSLTNPAPPSPGAVLKKPLPPPLPPPKKPS